jgi:cell division protein FtsQ
MGTIRNKNRRRGELTRGREVTSAVTRHRGTLGRLALATAISVGLFGGAWYVREWAISTHHFAVRQIAFAGLTRVSDGELLKLAGLTPGQNLLALDLEAMERAIATHPWVRSVEVSRRLPSSISVAVEEHVAVALVSLGELYLLDRQGNPFRRVQPGDPLNLPLVTGVDRDAYVVDPAREAARVAEGLDVADAYLSARSAKRWPLSEVRLDSMGVTLVTGDGGQELRLGRGDTKEKLARLSQVREELDSRSLQADVIHLDNRARPGWVAVRPAGLPAPKVSLPVSERNGRR